MRKPITDGAIAIVDTAAELTCPGTSLLRRAWSTMTGANDRAIEDEIERQLREVVDGLERKVHQLADELAALGERIDQVDAVQGVTWVQRLTAALREADGEAKRRALLNLAARQTDPRLGSRADRRHWWDVLVPMRDVEVQLVEWVATKGVKSTGNLYKFELASGEGGIGPAAGHRLRQLLKDGDRAPTESLFRKSSGARPTLSAPVVLSDYGEALWQAIKPIEPAAAELVDDSEAT